MRHFYTDANYCCVSQSFIHEGGLLSLGGVFFFFFCYLRRGSALSLRRAPPLREMSASRSDEETDVTKETTQAPLAPPDGSSLKALNYVSQRLTQSQNDLSALNISISPVSDKPWPCWRPRSIDYLQMPTDVQLMPIIVTFTERSLAAGSIILLLLLLVLFNKEIAHFTVPEIKPPYFLILVHLNTFLHSGAANTEASQQKDAARQRWRSLPFQLPVVDIFSYNPLQHHSCSRNSPVGKKAKDKKKEKKRNTSLWKNKGLVVSDKPLNLGQSSQRGMHTLIVGT